MAHQFFPRKNGPSRNVAKFFGGKFLERMASNWAILSRNIIIEERYINDVNSLLSIRKTDSISYSLGLDYNTLNEVVNVDFE